MTLDELKALRKNLPEAMISASFNNLYFWTVWGLAKRMIDEGIEIDKVNRCLASYADWLGQKAAPDLKMAIPNLGSDAQAAAKVIAFAWVLHDMVATSEGATVTIRKCSQYKNLKKNKLKGTLNCKTYCNPLIENFVHYSVGPHISMTMTECMPDGDKLCKFTFK
jgi:hypothetical protein